MLIQRRNHLTQLVVTRAASDPTFCIKGAALATASVHCAGEPIGDNRAESYYGYENSHVKQQISQLLWVSRRLRQ
jgi:hypothetical protein